MNYYGVVSRKLQRKDPIVKLFTPLFPCTLNKIYNNRGITIFLSWVPFFSCSRVKHSIAPFKYLLVCINYSLCSTIIPPDLIYPYLP